MSIGSCGKTMIIKLPDDVDCHEGMYLKEKLDA